MVFVYSKIQKPMAGTIFLMSETFDSNKYDSYVIKYYGFSGEVVHKKIEHQQLKEMLEKKSALRLSKPNFANYEEFIKIPIYG